MQQAKRTVASRVHPENEETPTRESRRRELNAQSANYGVTSVKSPMSQFMATASKRWVSFMAHAV